MRRKKSKPTKERLASTEEILGVVVKRLAMLEEKVDALTLSLLKGVQAIAPPPPVVPSPGEAPKPPGY